MVLVAGQGGAARERLLAIGIWALVGSLSRVDATMSRKTTRVTERLESQLVTGCRSLRWKDILFRSVRTYAASRRCGRVGGPSAPTAG
jgi:hypothetical protein